METPNTAPAQSTKIPSSSKDKLVHIELTDKQFDQVVTAVADRVGERTLKLEERVSAFEQKFGALDGAPSVQTTVVEGMSNKQIAAIAIGTGIVAAGTAATVMHIRQKRAIKSGRLIVNDEA